MRRLTKTLASLAGLTATALFLPGIASAAGVAAGDIVQNTATVNYDVNNVPQDDIESSPLGNSDPTAAGVPTEFAVDRIIRFTLVQDGAANTPVTPGADDQATAFILTNTSNDPIGFTFGAVDESGTTVNGAIADSFDLEAASIRVFADTDDDDVFTLATDTNTNVGTLAPDASIHVFVVGDIETDEVNATVANVALTADAVETSGAAIVASGTNDVDPLVEDTVIQVGTATASDGYEVSAPTLVITKSQAVINDFVTAGPAFLSIPGAQVDFTITIDNTGGSANAESVNITDIIAAELDVSGNTTVTITGGLAPTPASCTVDIADADTDGCGRTDEGPGPVFAATTLTIDPTAGITVAAGTTVTVVISVLIR